MYRGRLQSFTLQGVGSKNDNWRCDGIRINVIRDLHKNGDPTQNVEVRNQTC